MSGSVAHALDWALVGGFVHRDAASAPEPLAIGMKDGAIAFVGGEQELGASVPTRRLAGHHVYPGFADAHGHLYHLGARLEEVRLEDAHSADEVLARVRAAATSMPASAWVLGGGWDESLWTDGRMPSAEDLEAASGGRPACLQRRDCHAVWVSASVLALAGIDASTAEIEGGRILRDTSGRPTGVLIDRAKDLVTRMVPAPTYDAMRRRLLLAMRACSEAGLTAVHDMGVDAAELAALRELDREGRLPIRVHAAVHDEATLWAEEFARGPQKGEGHRRLAVRAVKLFSDGALGSRGAALFEDYTDDPGNRGLLLLHGDELIERLTRATRAGFQSCVHAIGDRANREVLDAFATMAGGPDGAAFLALRPRIEHAQVLAESDIARFAAIGVIASMQPVHAAGDQRWAEARLGTERARFAYANQSLAQAHARLCFGSDFPIETHDPREGLIAARTRALLGGDTGGGWNPSEQVSAEVAIAGYTSGPAYASFGENERGKIAEGYLADFTIWDRDLNSASAAELRQARVIATIVAGKLEHSALPPGAVVRR
ncbi:MAG TPA: amidohydrolase [Candidatus Eisenbacteria bacterium]|nr:amidohydrolase [Candidatus Eisenbacteria bacterium]